MSTTIRLGGVLLAAALSLPVSLALAAPGNAVDNMVSKDAPDLAKVRALIKALDYKTALSELYMLSDTVQHADVYNLMGFSLRKSGDYKTAATYYAKALDFNPEHKGALEYQGELFVETGELVKAKANLAKLATLCPQGCEERADLEKAIAAAPAGGGVKTN